MVKPTFENFINENDSLQPLLWIKEMETWKKWRKMSSFFHFDVTFLTNLFQWNKFLYWDFGTWYFKLGKKSSSSNSIFQTGELEKSSAETEGVRDRVMRGMLMQTDQRARTKVLLFMKPFYLNCQLSCEPGISIVCCFLTGPFQTHNCFKRKLTSAWFFFQLLSQISVFQDNTLFDDCMHPWLHGIT